MLQVTFPEIARLLESAESAVSAAEGHGCLCGALCTSGEYSLQRWVEELLPSAVDESDDVPAALQLLFNDTVAALRGAQMEFEPLVPDDEASLENRAAAVAQWCQGFLYGFGIGRTLKPEQLTGDVSEILNDMAQISQATVDVGTAGEEEEQAYADLIEYLRVGVQLIHDELADVRERAAESPPH